jgi:hypothetical protein
MMDCRTHQNQGRIGIRPGAHRPGGDYRKDVS